MCYKSNAELIQMTSNSTLKTVMTARVVRAIAILFLVYTGADLTLPEFCSEEMCCPRFAEASLLTGIRSDAAFVTGTSEPRQDPPTERSHSDEDCFCCCAHVLPGRATVSVAVRELNPRFRPLKKIDVDSPLLQGPYHPPRAA